MKYFSAFENVNELKAQYKKLAFQFHPDKGGLKEDFQAMSAEYERLLKDALNGRFETKEELEEELQIDEQMREALSKIITLEGIIIEIVGNWIWITGNSYAVKDDLKAASFKFARKKTAWYWHDGSYKRKSRKGLSLDEIRDVFGCKKVNSETKQRVLA